MAPEAESPASTRRNFLMRIGIALNVVAAALIAVPLIGYVASVMRTRSYQKWVKLGPMSEFPAGQTRLATYTNPFTVPWDGVTANIACWVRHMGDNKLQVFAINCAHLGCPVRWFPESKLFMCPCHGGVYYEDGSRASGPPPRGLFEYEYQVRGDELWVRGGQLPTLANAV
jgi:menaquinol-cytochrome c reductase iron-sulfur subunit